MPSFILDRSITQALIVSMLTVFLFACTAEPDCDQARETGREIGMLGMEREADRAETHPGCLEEYDQGWELGREAYCDDEMAFDLGLSDHIHYGICESREFRANFEMGRTLRVLSVEQESTELQIKAMEEGRYTPADGSGIGRLRQRERILEREIADLETLARTRGLMDPAELPEDM